MPTPTSEKDQALATLSDPKLSAAVRLPDLQKIAVREFARLANSERENALRAILLGLTLHRIKAGTKHGEWTPCLREILTSVKIWSPKTAQTNASYYMRLALCACARAKATVPELMALPADETGFAIEGARAAAKRLMDRLDDYVGERSLDEILRDEGIKCGQLGGKRERGGADGDLDPITAAQLYREQRLFLIAQGLDEIETAILRDNVFADLTADDIRPLIERITYLAKTARQAAKALLA